METTCCFSGHRPEKLVGGEENENPASPLRIALRTAVVRSVREGFDAFLCGMARGADTWAAEEVLALRDNGHPVRLIAVLPCPGQDSRWPEPDRRRFRRLLKQADDKFALCGGYTPYCMGARNLWMVEHAARLIAVFDGSPGGTANTIARAEAFGREILRVKPQTAEWKNPADFEKSLDKSGGFPL